ncbi:hypothetical protein CW751_07555 [Brumimicrobium salinarum]|uniref:PKD domain-containing protein n=1 Tax=Brumimicrobium salinarum TaxID=2058658 RepID=A0A2I0R371_9FLAO|nr:hypothetical protein [Brumimicrobium salinarum]PKR81013.1 hypothetical protein CW751_07555 [Brumimicrobium salinarum]
MKDNLENIIKNSLQDYEAPYDPKAWENVSAQLDAKAAANSGGVSSILKWSLAGTLVAVIIAGSYLLWFDNDVNLTTTKKGEVVEDIAKTNAENQPIIEESSKDQIKDKKKQHADNSINEESDLVADIPPLENVVHDEKHNSSSNEIISSQDEAEGVYNDGEVNNEQPKEKKFLSGILSAKEICEGETVYVRNNNENAQVKLKYSTRNAYQVILPGDEIQLQIKSSQEIQFYNQNNEVIGSQYVKVNPKPEANFTYEANIFEKGLPVVICETYEDYEAYEWFVDGEFTHIGEKMTHNLFKKADYKIALKVTDRNGCKGINTKTVRIHNKYNLMAVDAFKPNGSDARNRTFMPYSLTQRDVQFVLTIVDPVDNHVVFKSENKNNAWDGLDNETGKMTPANKTYIWKVQILNPLKNERPIYSGTIVHN